MALLLMKWPAEIHPSYIASFTGIAQTPNVNIWMFKRTMSFHEFYPQTTVQTKLDFSICIHYNCINNTYQSCCRCSMDKERSGAALAKSCVVSIMLALLT
jgi:hypothetical protein